MTTLHALLDTLDQFLHDLQDQGIRSVPCNAPLPPAPDALPPPSVRQAKAASPGPVPAPPPQAASAPPAPPAESGPEGELVMLWLERLADCMDATPPDQTAVLLILEPGELRQPEYRELLSAMLHAIGYPLPPGEGEPVHGLPDGPRKAARILCMGEKANAQFCTVNMGLSLVRGKWQASPAGRMIATHAPSYLMDNPAGKRAAWNDLQKLLEDLGLDVPEWTRKKLRN